MMKRKPHVSDNTKENKEIRCLNEEDALSSAANLCACSLVSENKKGDRSYKCWNEYCGRDFGSGYNYEYMLNRESGIFSLASSISSACDDSKTKDDLSVDKLKSLLSKHFLQQPDSEYQHDSLNCDDKIKDQNYLCKKLNAQPCFCVTYDLNNACNKLHRERSSSFTEESIPSRANSISDNSDNSLNSSNKHQHVASVSAITDDISHNVAQLTPESKSLANAEFIGYSSKNDFADPASDIICNEIQ